MPDEILMRIARIGGVALGLALPAAAQYCTPQKFAGVYGFQLEGTTTISGEAKPVASMGRLEFDGQGGVSGAASVNFAGFLLGNPVTGNYQLRDDCTLNWSLQDDSGAHQNFSGKLSSDLARATFRQTDPGGARRGTLAKAPDTCSQSGIQGAYDFTISGSATPMNPGDTARKIAMEGVVSADGNGNLTLVDGGNSRAAGSAAVESDCIVNITLQPAAGGEIKLRGIVVTSGKEILAIETDPGTTVNAHMRAR